MILTDRIDIRNLTCSQSDTVERVLLCQWIAKPHALVYEVVITRKNGSEILRQNASSELTVVEVDDSAGNIITVSVENISTTVELRGTSVHCLHINNRSNSALCRFSVIIPDKI